MLKKNKNGMTIIEVLVVIGIISILAAGLYSAGNYADKQAKIKYTESTIQMLSAAIEQYRDFYSKLPDANDANGMPPGYGSLKNGEKWYYKLTLAPDAKKILNQINPSLIKDVDKNSYPEVVDAWGTAFRYNYVNNAVRQDNFPVITSAGPDKDFGDSDSGKKNDNITSR